MSRALQRLIWIGASFLILSAMTRVGLALLIDEAFTALQWGRFMGVGLFFDVVVLPWFLLPWVLYEAIMPARSGKWESWWAALWGTAYLCAFIIISASEFTFWEEFGSRFDFIAVDYLIYTHEVIGNIRESYPVNWWISAIVVFSATVAWYTWPRSTINPRSTLGGRFGRVAVVGLAAALGLGAVDKSLGDTSSSAFVQQLSNNGVYSFGHAFHNNELDYQKYYPTLPPETLNATVRDLVGQSNTTYTGAGSIERKVAAYGARKNVNVVLISLESMSASFMEHFGETRNLTPELDKLADKGLFFTNLYATGTRTVRGLEALTVGTPPTPGQSIVRRPNNDNLVSLGVEAQGEGSSPYWIYGGYGFFDNMNAYYAGNGYKVVDRTDADESGIKIHAENVWGIADEDLYSLAMLSLDKEHAKGRPFFAQIMTTSNHRPYTFPENRIDLPQKKREGAVKYTDWAVGDFIRRAADKPWFDNTVFVIISDHTSKAAGKTDLPLWRYHIPMIWYAPKLIEPATMDRLMSQIDVGPTLLGWLGVDYTSRFFGYDMHTLEAGRERAFISTYQKLGYLKNGRLVVLDVNRKPIVTDADAKSPADTSNDQRLIDEAITWYQSASQYFQNGNLKDVARDGDGQKGG